jgi:hypothetical protein
MRAQAPCYAWYCARVPVIGDVSLHEHTLLETLRALEVALHQPSVRRDRGQLERLLHPNFREFGRSGRAYDRAEMLELLAGSPQEPQPAKIWSQDFALHLLPEASALLTYRSANVSADGTLERYTNRSSVWQLDSRRLANGLPPRNSDGSVCETCKLGARC